jgi:hypothetical protein
MKETRRNYPVMRAALGIFYNHGQPIRSLLAVQAIAKPKTVISGNI